MEKINISRLLKDCPRGMELDCVNYDGIVTFEEVSDCPVYPINISIKYGNESFSHTLTKYGQTCRTPYSKCVIFPKGKTTWEGFIPPYKFKDDNVLYFEVGDIIQHKTQYYTSVVINISNDGFYTLKRDGSNEDEVSYVNMKYRYDDYKLIQPVTPIFKKNDIIQHKERKSPARIVKIDEFNRYVFENGDKLPCNLQDKYEFVSDKFDTNKLIPFESQILVRHSSFDIWKPAIFGMPDLNGKGCFVVGGIYYAQFIPYNEDNKKLINTNTKCDKFYWK